MLYNIFEAFWGYKLAKNILITGGAGFVGVNLTEKLIQNKENMIFCVDNFASSSKANIERFLGCENFKFIEHDVIFPLEIDEKIDEIYNLACVASPIHYQGKNAIFTTKTCVFGAINLLELARKNDAKILQASTSEIYGNALCRPQKENYFGNVNPNGIRSCYDEGKRCAESLFFDYQRNYNVKIKVARIFNTYGKYMAHNDGRVVSNFIWQALNNKPLEIYGDGTQTRSFCYVDDLIEGLIRLMATDDKFFGPVNLGNPDEFTINELSQLIIKKMAKYAPKLDYKPLPMDDPIKRNPDISLAKEKLNWSPKIKLDKGLDLTIEYFSRKFEEMKK